MWRLRMLSALTGLCRRAGEPESDATMAPTLAMYISAGPVARNTTPPRSQNDEVAMKDRNDSLVGGSSGLDADERPRRAVRSLGDSSARVEVAEAL